MDVQIDELLFQMLVPSYLKMIVTSAPHRKIEYSSPDDCCSKFSVFWRKYGTLTGLFVGILVAYIFQSFYYYVIDWETFGFEKMMCDDFYQQD